MRAVALLTMMLISAGTEAYAQQDCTKALVPKEATKSYDELTNIALAYSLSVSAFEEARHQVGFNGSIFGISAKGSYDEYHREASSKSERYHYENFKQIALQIATRGLDEFSVRAYEACLMAGEGTYLTEEEGTSTASHTVRLLNRPPENVKKDLRGRLMKATNLSEADEAALRQLISELDFSRGIAIPLTVIPSDPRVENIITIDVEAGGASITLPPLRLPSPPPPPPPVISFRVEGTLFHGSTQERYSQKFDDCNMQVVSNINVTDFTLSVIQYSDAKECSRGVLTPHSMSFPSQLTFATCTKGVTFADRFEGGAQVPGNLPGKVIQIFLRPSNRC